MWVKINHPFHFYINDTNISMEKVGTRLKLKSYTMRLRFICFLKSFLWSLSPLHRGDMKGLRYEDTFLQHTN